MRQVNVLLQGNRQPQMAVPLANPAAQAQILRDYMPASNSQRASQQGIMHAERIQPMQFQLREESEEEELQEPDASQTMDNLSSSQQDVLPRRSERSRREHYSPFGDDFM